MKVMRDIIKHVAPFSKDAHPILVTNPSDITAQITLKASGFAPEKLIKKIRRHNF